MVNKAMALKASTHTQLRFCSHSTGQNKSDGQVTVNEEVRGNMSLREKERK